MNKRSLKENSFDGAPGGIAGAVSSQPGAWAGTQNSGFQNSQNFAHSDDNKAVNQKGGRKKPETLDQSLSTMYSKKESPTPDDVVAGIKYELGQQIKKDKFKAKQEVIMHLKEDPRYYRDLKQLNITDKDMVDNMTETKHPNDKPLAHEKIAPNIEETKKIFAEMAKGRGQKYVVNSQIVDVMKEMWEAKQQRSAWKTSK